MWKRWLVQSIIALTIVGAGIFATATAANADDPILNFSVSVSHSSGKIAATVDGSYQFTGRQQITITHATLHVAANECAEADFVGGLNTDVFGFIFPFNPPCADGGGAAYSLGNSGTFLVYASSPSVLPFDLLTITVKDTAHNITSDPGNYHHPFLTNVSHSSGKVAAGISGQFFWAYDSQTEANLGVQFSRMTLNVLANECAHVEFQALRDDGTILDKLITTKQCAGSSGGSFPIATDSVSGDPTDLFKVIVHDDTHQISASNTWVF
jgi:hypothetical protein